MTKEQEEKTIKYLEVLQKEYLEDAKRRKENGEITGYGTMEDIDKLRALYIGFALDMLKEKDKELEKKDKIIDLMTEFLGESDLGYYKKKKGGEFLGIMRRYNKTDWKEYFEEMVKKEK